MERAEKHVEHAKKYVEHAEGHVEHAEKHVEHAATWKRASQTEQQHNENSAGTSLPMVERKASSSRGSCCYCIVLFTDSDQVICQVIWD